jgi:CrcB protein
MNKTQTAFLVLIGGMCGTFARYWLSEAGGEAGYSDFESLAAVNTAGAFLLGFLGSVLSESKSDFTAALNAFCGTGFLGSFTTFSFLAVLIEAMHAEKAALCMGLSIVLGLAACFIGMRLGAALLRARKGGDESHG